MRYLLCRSSYYLDVFSNWLYQKGTGVEDYTSPSYCEHCGKWNFEPEEKVTMKKLVVMSWGKVENPRGGGIDIVFNPHGPTLSLSVEMAEELQEQLHLHLLSLDKFPNVVFGEKDDK